MPAKRAPSLVQIFNSFAKQAVKDFPELKDRFILYSATTASWHGNMHLSQAWEERLIDKAEHKKEENAGITAYAELKHKYRLITYLNPASRCMTAAGQSRAKEINAVLEHELAHLIAPCGYDERHGENFCECVADAYSFIRQQKETQSMHAINATIWRSVSDFMTNGESVHFTTPALIALKSLSKRHDLSKLTPVEAANLAYRLSLRHAYTPAQMRALKKAYAPLRKRHKEGKPVSQKSYFRIMMQDHGKHTRIIFEAGLAMLTPYLEGRTSVLATCMTRKKAKEAWLKGSFWTTARQKIVERLKAYVPDARQQQLDHLEMLGAFDSQKPGLISPKAYETPGYQRKIAKRRQSWSIAA